MAASGGLAGTLATDLMVLGLAERERSRSCAGSLLEDGAMSPGGRHGGKALVSSAAVKDGGLVGSPMGCRIGPVGSGDRSGGLPGVPEMSGAGGWPRWDRGCGVRDTRWDRGLPPVLQRMALMVRVQAWLYQ